MLSKKGLSGVVVTVSLIFLTIVAIGLIAGFIIPLVKNNLKEGTECFDYRNYFVFDDQFDFNCYQKVGEDYLYAVTIKANSIESEKADKISSFVLGFDMKSGVSNSIEVPGGVRGTEIGMIRRLDESIVDLEIPRNGEVRTYVYNNGVEKVNQISIAPILDSGKVCDVTDSIKTISTICINSIAPV